MLVIAAALEASAGCGGGDSSASPADFVGTWEGTSGELTDVCGDATTMPAFTTFELQFQSDGAAGVQLVDGSCVFQYAVSGASATLKGTQTCTTPGGTATWTRDVFTLSGDRNAMTEVGELTSVIPGSATPSCKRSLSIHYVRVGTGTTGGMGCGICDKAGACCKAYVGSASSCSIYSTAMCNAQPAAEQDAYGADICQTLLDTLASSGLAACAP
jgi:hypothetical protein